MLESECRNNGIVKIPIQDTYTESGEQEYEEHPVSYFLIDSNFRDNEDALQLQTQFYCKGYEQRIPANSKFIDADGNEYDIRTAEFVFNIFENQFEFNILTVV